MNGKDYILDNDMYFCLTTRPKWKYIKARDIYCMDYKSISRYMDEIIGKSSFNSLVLKFI